MAILGALERVGRGAETILSEPQTDVWEGVMRDRRVSWPSRRTRQVPFLVPYTCGELWYQRDGMAEASCTLPGAVAWRAGAAGPVGMGLGAG